eukprot:gene5260-8028_t
MTLRTATLGFPRTGPKREMKEALEKFWGGKISEADLLAVSKTVLQRGVKDQVDAGIKLIGVGDHTLYDHVLDWSERFGLTARRVKDAKLTGLAAYFTQARGRDGIHALDMTKYFDSNYHNMVPEVPSDVTPALNQTEVDRYLTMLKDASEAAQGSSSTIVPVILGPVTLAKLCKTEAPLTSDQLLEKLLPCYAQLLAEIKKSSPSVTEVQFHEPWLVKTEAAGAGKLYELAFAAIAKAAAAQSFDVNVSVHFDSVDKDVYQYLVKLPVKRITLDFCRGTGMLQTVEALGFPKEKELGAGAVDGRNIWKNLEAAQAIVARLLKVVGDADRVVVSPSCSLQYVPYDVTFEKALPAALQGKVAFAVQKLAVVAEVAKTAPSVTVNAEHPILIEDNATPPTFTAAQASMLSRPEPFPQRRPKQIHTPMFPTTTIGSFPQTPELRKIRLAFKQKKVSEEEYNRVIDTEIQRVIKAQQDMGLDVFVHGEPERSDMVEHFGVKLEGMAFSQHGWVQSYGSRYVRPPIIYDTIKRKEPMTVREFKVAQKAAGETPVKGMLTGPVTILNWSFCRTDITRAAQAVEIAGAIREEVKDLEDAGCRVIQVDEAALRERMPLKRAEAPKYMDWAVKAFRLSTAVAKSSTQIVTHMCYSSFEDIIPFIDEMDADVLTIENSRSGNEMLAVLAQYGYAKDVGPGVYDIHSPVVPTEKQLVAQVERLKASGLPLDRIWVNPDCGLKTRKWEEVIPSLTNMVNAAKEMRAIVTAA